MVSYIENEPGLWHAIPNFSPFGACGRSRDQEGLAPDPLRWLAPGKLSTWSTSSSIWAPLGLPKRVNTSGLVDWEERDNFRSKASGDYRSAQGWGIAEGETIWALLARDYII